ncbi:MAG: FliO/MopB family protein [Bacteriovoracaceae bacterium]
MFRKIVVGVVSTLVAFGAFAGVKVTNLDLKTEGQNGFVNVAIDGRSNSLPDVKVFGNTIEITLTNAEPFNAITKTIRGAVLTANVLNGKAIVRATLPYAINASGVDLGWKNNNIEILFPRGVVTATINRAPTREVTLATDALAPVKAPVAAPTAKVEEKKTEATQKTFKEPGEGASKLGAVKKEELNEDYLNKLMNEGKDTPRVEAAKDEVKTAAAAPARAEAKVEVPKAPGADSFSFAGYAAKFSIFLALVLGLFYGVVQVLKKGVFNKGKLGFLNNGKMIEVLSTTYVAPKKSLMIVKAHKQLFLVANSENGIQFLAEMKDTSGIIKEGEKAITGTNFDLSMFTAEATTETTTVTLKENIMESTPVQEETPLSRIAKATDVVKFSEELKKKAKKLKPIEFN